MRGLSAFTVALLVAMLVLSRGSPERSEQVDFTISSDPAEMVLALDHAPYSMRVYGDGRARIEVEAGTFVRHISADGVHVQMLVKQETSYWRQLERARLLSIVRSMVGHGIADYVTVDTPCDGERIEVTLRLAEYSRPGLTGQAAEGADFCAPDVFRSPLPQRHAVAELLRVLEELVA